MPNVTKGLRDLRAEMDKRRTHISGGLTGGAGTSCMAGR